MMRPPGSQEFGVPLARDRDDCSDLQIGLAASDRTQRQRLEHDLQLVEYQNWEKLEQIAAHYFEAVYDRAVGTAGALAAAG